MFVRVVYPIVDYCQFDQCKFFGMTIVYIIQVVSAIKWMKINI